MIRRAKRREREGLILPRDPAEHWPAADAFQVRLRPGVRCQRHSPVKVTKVLIYNII